MAWTAPRTWTTGEVVTAAMGNTNWRDNMNAVAPVGSYMYVAARSGGNAVETVWQGGWLEANGASVLRATYAALDTYLASLTPTRPFGTADGTHVTLPDMQARSPVHHTLAGHADTSTLANSDGVALASRRPRHKHTVNDPGHVHTFNTFIVVPSAIAGTGGGRASSGDSGQPTINSSTTGITIGPQTGAEPTDSSGYLVGGVWVVKF
jgi:microcystin-dependent protein